MVLQSSLFDGLSFYPFTLKQDGGVPSIEANDQVRAIAEREIACIPSLWQGFLAGAIPVT